MVVWIILVSVVDQFHSVGLKTSDFVENNFEIGTIRLVLLFLQKKAWILQNDIDAKVFFLLKMFGAPKYWNEKLKLNDNPMPL